MAHPPHRPEPIPARPITEQIRGLWGYSRRALALVWATNRRLGVLLGSATVLGGVLPAAAAWIGKRLVDAIVLGISAHAAGTPALEAATPALEWIVAEAGVMALLAANQRAISVIQSLLQAQLGHRVNVMILEKAVQLELSHFEDPDFYDKLTRARREASSRPLSLVMRTFGLIQNTISLVAYAGLLLGFSPWAVVVLVLAGVPAFVVEAKFSGSAFRLFRWRSPETRRQNYLEMVLSNDQYAKEVQVFGFGPLLLERYRDIFSKLYQADRDLTIRRAWWGFSLGLLGTAAFYGIYAWIGIAAVTRRITLGDMTMYILLFKQGQSAVAASLAAIGGMYEDNLYLSTLSEYLEQPIVPRTGGALVGPAPGSGLVFEGVSFTYPGSERPAVADIDLTLRRGEALALVGENGSGKTTLIKLLAGLYRPDRGRILLDGLPLEAWDTETLRRRIAIVFQDYGRYQLLAGENVGIGDPVAVTEEERWRQAATLGMAAPFLEALPEGYNTQLGRWFGGGRELSGGQWQKVALSRAFMRRDADILVLDEPTAAMDAEAEAIIFEHVRRLSRERAVILISHRFSTVRMADHIVVLEDGRIVERGSHEELIAQAGRYARLFELQATGYR